MGRREKMQTRTITVDYARPRGYDVGYRAENNFTELSLPVPAELEGADSYRVYFESTVGKYLQTELLTPTDGYVTVKITSDIVPEPGNMAAQLVAFADGEIVGYAPVITGTAKVSIPDGTERLSHSLAAEIALNTAARHTHDNKGTLDKLSDSNGILTYDGKVLGDGSKKEIFKIPVTVTELEEPADGESFKVEHTMTLAEIEAATKEGKTLTVLANRRDTTYTLPLLYYISGTYCFYIMVGGTAALMLIGMSSGDEGETPEEVWQYQENNQVIYAEDINYYNQNNTSLDTAQKALDKLLTDSHIHANKDTLDKLSDSNGKLQYNGSDVSLKPAYYIDLAGTYPNYTCPATMDDIKAAYNSGYNLVCRCTMGKYTAALPLFVPMPAANTWIFSGSGALQSMGFPAQSFTIAITSDGVKAQNKELVTSDGSLPNPYHLVITAGDDSFLYDGRTNVNAVVQPKTQRMVLMDGDNTTLANNTEYYLTDASNLTLTYPTTDYFECWMRLTFAATGTITVTLPADTEYLGATPNFKNGETWELSFKDKVLVAKKVGDDGEDSGGITPTIGANGNWYLGTTDTGKPSRGEKGDTPAKGTDYWTEADKKEIVQKTLAALPTWTGGEY